MRRKNQKRFGNLKRGLIDIVDVRTSESTSKVDLDTGTTSPRTFDVRRFNPPCVEWQRHGCLELGVSFKKEIGYGIRNIPLNTPASISKIIGDGNCLYRAISYSLTGSEEYHAQIRQGLFYFYMFKIDRRLVSNHLPLNESFDEHVRGVGTNRTWGTDVDILALAAFLNIGIHVYRTFGEGSWHTFSPQVFNVGKNAACSSYGLYIQNTNGNHYDVVTAVDIHLMEQSVVNSFLPPDAEEQARISSRFSLSRSRDVAYTNVGRLVGHGIICSGMTFDFYSAVAQAVSGGSDEGGCSVLRQKMREFMISHSNRVEHFLGGTETVEEHCEKLLENQFKPDRVDLLTLASLAKTDMLIHFCSGFCGDESHSSSWEFHDAGEFLGDYRSKEKCCIYLQKSASGFRVVTGVKELGSVDFGNINIAKKPECSTQHERINSKDEDPNDDEMSQSDCDGDEHEDDEYASRNVYWRQYRRKSRADPTRGPKLAQASKRSKSTARADPVRGPKLAQDSKRSKSTARADPTRGPKLAQDSKRSKSAARADPVRGSKLAEDNKRSKSTARADPTRGPKLAQDSKRSKSAARADPVRGSKLAEDNKRFRSEARADPTRGPKLAQYSKKNKAADRSDPTKGPLLRDYDAKCKKLYYECPGNRQNRRELDIIRKRIQRSSPAYSQLEKENDSTRKRKKRACITVESARKKLIYQDDPESTGVAQFREATSVGCDYVCSVCHQTWFFRSVSEVTPELRNHDSATSKCLTGERSFGNKEWICHTCLNHVRSGRVPALSVSQNGMAFPDVPDLVADLRPLEERLVCPRQVFMSMQELPRGGQISIRGNVVNVPVDVAPTIGQLPRNIDDCGTVTVKLKKRKRYKTAVFHQTVRPIAVARAAEVLCEMPLYKKEHIKLDDDWIKRLHETDNIDETRTQEFMENFFAKGSDEHSLDLITTDMESSCNEDARTNDHIEDEFLPKREIGRENNNRDDVDNDGVNNSEDESDGFSEVDITETNAGICDTLLDTPDYSDKTLVLAPGEDRKPSSLYHDTDAEYLAFPTIYGGQRPPENPKRIVSYSERCKWECRHRSGRIGKSVPNLFFKMKKLQLKQVANRVALAVRRMSGKRGGVITAKDVKEDKGANLLKLDDGFEIFKTIRNSPPYLQKRQRDVFAMIKQLSTPTWFFSLSSADTRWSALLRTLSKQQWNRDLSDEDIVNLTWEERSTLVKNDPTTCARYFENRCREFIKMVMSDASLLGGVTDYFYRVEFQQRGSPHIHGLFWVHGAPNVEMHTEEEVCAYIDHFISCSGNADEQNTEFLELQRHKHSKTCRKKGKAICRFNYPIPPMRKTCILTRLVGDEHDDTKIPQYRSNFEKIEAKLGSLWKNDRELSFDEFLVELDMTEEDYMLAIRSSLKRQTVFLKREPSEIRINSYMKNLLGVWQANHDIQYVLDPYACAVYILAYIAKSQRGMSTLLDAAVREARSNSSNIRERVRHVGNKFTNAAEIGAQEASYLILGLPLTKSSRKVTFVNTAPPGERTFLLKSAEEIQALDDDSTDIAQQSVLHRYIERPGELEGMCYADYISKITVSSGKKVAKSSDIHEEEEDFADDQIRDEPILIDSRDAWSRHLPLKLANGNVIQLKKNPEVVRSIGYSDEIDSEKHYREKLMLFSNWRREEDLMAEKCYESRYRQLKDEIDQKQKEYYKLGAVLENAKAEARDDLQDEFDLLAPNTENEDAIDEDEGPSACENFALYLPENKAQEHYDIGIEFNCTNSDSSSDIEMRVRRVPDAQFYAGVRSFNLEQREFFTHVMHSIRNPSDPLCVFLSGGAGVGKSHVINMLYQAIDREHMRQPGSDSDSVRVLLCAPTGKAAFNIQGHTIHSAFRIKPNQSLSIENQKLGDSELNTLRSKFRDLSVVIIDEVSMVGRKMLTVINDRLKQIRGSNAPFGGYSMIFVGDLFQLKPVFDDWIFEYAKTGADALGPSIWHDHVKLFELTTIMRQKDDQHFAELLNRMREGNHTEEDVELLNTRIIQPGEHINTPHLCCLNDSVNDHNRILYDIAVKAGADHALIHAQHVSVQSDVLGERNLQKFLRSEKANEACAGLEPCVPLVVGQEYEVSVNLSVDDGLMNGSACTIMKLDYIREDSKANSVPDIVWVNFCHERIGSKQKSDYRNYYKAGIDHSWVPIFAVRREFSFYNLRLARIQVPLRQSAAKTVHKCQGESKPEAVIDITYKRSSQPHSHYVAFSRVTKLEGLHILHMHRKKKLVDGELVFENTATRDGTFIKVDKKVVEEMRRLRMPGNRLELNYVPIYSLTNGITVVFHNTRSLHAHFADLSFDPNFTSADVVCCAETRLTSNDPDHHYSISGFQLLRFDQKTASAGCRPAHGLAIYVRDRLVVVDQKSICNPNYEFVYAQINSALGSFQIMCVYVSPKTNWVKFRDCGLEGFLSIINKVDPIVILGDFNQLATSSLLTLLHDQFGLTQLIDAPTTVYGSCLDLIFSNIKSVTAGVLDVCWSDHSVIWLNANQL